MRGMRTSEIEPGGDRESSSGTTVPAVGVLLAGGRSRRMGGDDKSFLSLAGRTMIDRVLGRLAAQVQQIVISAGGDTERFAATGRPIVPDPIAGFVGPLAGILGGMFWAREHAPKAKHIVTAAVDTPFLPLDLVDRLSAAAPDDTGIAIASSGGRLHHVCGLWPIASADDLNTWLADPGNRAVHQWAEQRGFCAVVFEGEPDPFLNVNTPSDLALAESWLAKGAA